LINIYCAYCCISLSSNSILHDLQPFPHDIVQQYTSAFVAQQIVHYFEVKTEGNVFVYIFMLKNK
jgi:hypothetical protein